MLEFPDVSHYTPVNLAGAPAAVAKVSQGQTYVDPTYANFRKQAAALRIPFSGYHWVDGTDPAGQARNYRDHAAGAPCMLDVEATGGTVPQTLAVAAALRALEVHTWGVYLPRWWWRDHLSSPDLRPLAAAGMVLVSSNYTTAPGAGWQPYGGVTPTVWQYTDKQVLNGVPCDFNRYQGTVAQLALLFTGTTPPPTPSREVDMAHFLTVANGGKYLADAAFERVWAFNDTALFNKVHAAAGNPPLADVAQADVEAGAYGQFMGFYKVPRQAPTGTGPSAADIATAVVDLEHDRLAS